MSSDKNWLRDWEIPDYRLTVRLIDHPGEEGPPHEVWAVDLVEVEDIEQFDLDTMQRLANALQSEDEGTASFVISQNRTYINWGADAAAQQLVVEVAANIVQMAAAGIIGSSVYDALKALVRSLVASARDKSEWKPAPISELEAVYRARWHIIRNYGLKPDEDGADRSALETLGVGKRSDGSWLVRLKDHESGVRFEVELLDEDGLVVIGKSGWDHDGGHN